MVKRGPSSLMEQVLTRYLGEIIGAWRPPDWGLHGIAPIMTASDRSDMEQRTPNVHARYS
jgi:hypothetical protein